MDVTGRVVEWPRAHRQRSRYLRVQADEPAALDELIDWLGAYGQPSRRVDSLTLELPLPPEDEEALVELTFAVQAFTPPRAG